VNLNKLIPGTNLENWKLLMSGQDVGALKGSEITLNIAEEIKFLADRSTQLGHRLVAWRGKREFGLTLTLYDWDFDILAALLDMTVSTTKLRDKIQSRISELPMIFQAAKVLNFETPVTAETIVFTGVGETPFTKFTFPLANTRIVPGTLSFTLVSPAEAITDDEYGRLTGAAAAPDTTTGRYNIETGIGELTLVTPIAAITSTDGAYSYYSDKQVEVRFPRAAVQLGGDTSFSAEGEGTGLPIIVQALMGANDYSMEIEFVAV